jgi:hypothetical protein
MMRRIARILVQCLSLLIASGVSSSALSFHANLSSIKVDAEPGEIVNTQFSLTLAADQPQTRFHLRTQDFYRSEDGRQSFYKPAGTLTHSCANWVAINPVETTVQPGAEMDARLTINVPGDAKPGGYWCVLSVDEVPDPHRVTPKGVGMELFTSISVGVFVTVQPVQKSARIEDVQVADNHVTVKVADTGNCPFSAEGRVEFLKAGDETPSATTKFPRTPLFCEPINTSLLIAELPDEKTLPAGRYRVRVILDIGLDHYIAVQKDMDIARVAATPHA